MDNLVLPRPMTGMEIYLHVSRIANMLNFQVRSPLLPWRPSDEHIHCSVDLPSKKVERDGRIFEITRHLNILHPQSGDIFLENSKEYTEVTVDKQAGMDKELIGDPEFEAMDKSWHKSHILMQELFINLFLENLEIN